MRIADLERILDDLAPFSLAESWDNSGLQVGDREATVGRVLVALEITDPVIEEALSGGFDTVVTHHPLLFAPVRTLVESRPRERMLRTLIVHGISVFSCHTNLDSARDGIADMVAAGLGLSNTAPLQPVPAGWYKLVGFIPPESLEKVAEAVFSAGAGMIGDYTDCAFSLTGQGWFTPGAGATPTVGRLHSPERTPEVRWETVVPRGRLREVIGAFVEAHPYEEPAFNIYPVEDVLPTVGLGRIGDLFPEETVESLAGRLASELHLPTIPWTGDGSRPVKRVAVVPGSGRSLIELAAARADVFVTGDLGHHDAERAAEEGLALIAAPHGELEWYAMKRWVPLLRDRLPGEQVEVTVSTCWRSPWNHGSPEPLSAPVAVETGGGPTAPARPFARAHLFVDGGSRGNPGASAIGVVLQDDAGTPVAEFGRAIGVSTNNIAEYRALLAGLEIAAEHGFREVAIFSDSELLVKQIHGTYRVRSEGLKPLHKEALARLRTFELATIAHVDRELNAEADRLVNQALDAATGAS